MSAEGLSLNLPDAIVEAIAERAAEIVLERQGEMPDSAEGYLDVEAAAAFLSCTPSRIYALKSAGRIPFHKDGSRLLFDAAELRAYVAEGGARRP